MYDKRSNEKAEAMNEKAAGSGRNVVFTEDDEDLLDEEGDD